jgi:hypothetical protein
MVTMAIELIRAEQIRVSAFVNVKTSRTGIGTLTWKNECLAETTVFINKLIYALPVPRQY